MTNKRLLPALLLLALCGCFKSKDELTLNADGSGSVHIETRVLVAPETLQSLGFSVGAGGEEGQPPFYPPTSEEEARRLFPEKLFTVTVKEEKEGDGSALFIDASFKDVNALLNSPYARAHGLALVVTNGALSLKAVIGIEPAARLAETKQDEAGLLGGQRAGLEELFKVKDRMRAEFQVLLPSAATSASAGAARDGRRVTWIADRQKANDAAEFAQQAGAVLEASCPAEGLKFSPVSSLRLGMVTFSNAPAGVLVQSAALDTNQIAAAARFVPSVLRITRTLDLSGEVGALQNHAQLSGAIALPRNLAPQKWGDVVLDTVVDAAGTSLMLPQAGDEFEPSRRYGRRRNDGQMEEKEEGDGAEKPSKDPELRHPVALEFQPPEWKVKKIARLHGSIALHYFSGAQVVKISHAIPTGWIRVVKRENDFDFEPAGQAIDDPKLAANGLTLRLTMGVSQSTFTWLTLDTTGSTASLTDGQVYDAEGRAWPTFFKKEGSAGANSMTLAVVGQLKAPFSLALVASGAGVTVTVPIQLENVPVDTRPQGK